MTRSIAAAAATLVYSIATFTIGAAPANANEGGGVRIGLHGSTLGLGASAEMDLSEQLSARAMFSTFGLDYEETDSGNRYEGDLDLQSIGLVADWRPFSGGFRLTGGLFFNNNEVTATAQADDLDIGGNQYDGKLNMLLDFAPVAPYLGVGWSSGYGTPGLGFSVDAGLLFQQSPRISGSGSVDAGGCTFRISDSGAATVTGCSDAFGDALKKDLESEHAELSDELDDFKWYPVLSFGVSYRF